MALVFGTSSPHNRSQSYRMQALYVLLQVPFSPEPLQTDCTLDLLLHATLVVHVSQHNALCRIPPAALQARVVLAVPARQAAVQRGVLVVARVLGELCQVQVLAPVRSRPLICQETISTSRSVMFGVI